MPIIGNITYKDNKTMLYFITLLLVVIIIALFLIIRNQWAMLEGQVIATKNQVFMSHQIDGVLEMKGK